MPAKVCQVCQDAPATKSFGMCDPCAVTVAIEANGGAKCSDPVLHDRVAAIMWPRHKRGQQQG